MLDIRCPSCKRQLQIPEDAVARECQCPVCAMVFLLPQSARSTGGQITAAVPTAPRKEAIVTALTDDPAAFNEAAEGRGPDLRGMKDVPPAAGRLGFCWRRRQA